MRAPRKMLGIVLVVAVMAMGCTRLGRVPQRTYKTPGLTFPQMVTVQAESVDTTDAAAVGEYQGYAGAIATDLNFALRNPDAPAAPVFSIPKIRLSVHERFASAAMPTMVFLSTILPIPVSFIRTQNDVDYAAEYTVAAADGHEIYTRTVEGRVEGWYSGWSVVRFAKRGNLRQRQGPAVSTAVANEIANDVVLNLPMIRTAARGE